MIFWQSWKCSQPYQRLRYWYSVASVCRLSSCVTWSIVVKRCILEQKLLLRAYRKSYKKWIGTKMNDLDLWLEVVSRSCQPLRYIRCWISWEPLEIEAWFQRTTNLKWHMGYQMDTWPMTSRVPQRCCEAVRLTILATAWLLVIKVTGAGRAVTFTTVSLSLAWTWHSFCSFCHSVVHLVFCAFT